MVVLVLGGCGFIGSHVVDGLVAAGQEVRVLGRKPEYLRPEIAGVDYRIADFSDSAAVASALAGCATVFHLITTLHPSVAETNPVEDVEGNLVGTLRLLQAMEAANVRRLVYLSSGGMIYGAPTILPTPENHPLAPISSYGIVKAAIEGYLESARRRGFLVSVLRPGNVYGPRQEGSANPAFITTALAKVARDEDVVVFGNGKVVRDYLHVQDLVNLCLLALADDVGQTLNAGTGRGYSLLEVVDAIRSVTGRPARLRFLPGRAIDVPESVLDFRKAQDRFGWRPTISLEMGLADTWAKLQARG